MSQYVTGSLVSLAVFSLGVIAAALGINNYKENKKSISGRRMLYVFWSVFFWTVGYAWMGLCYESEFAYVPRAIALLAVTFYVFFIMRYIATVCDFPRDPLYIYLSVYLILSLASWTQVISKKTVSFGMTPWGYWYKAEMTPGRILQFATMFSGFIMYYIILHYGRKHTNQKRILATYRQFAWFGPILMLGYALDTILPMVFHTYAIPGSALGSFFSALVLYYVSKKNRTFGLTRTNVANYVFEDVYTPVIVTDQNEQILMCNNATMDYLGEEEELILKKKFSDIFAVQEADDIYNVIGTEKMCRLNRTNVHDDYGDLMYAIFFAEDMTRILNYLNLLEESRKMADAANQAKGDFLANMSHEIRTPINAVLGMDEMILRESSEKPILEYAQNIKQAGNLLLSLINDILDFTKIEKGKMELSEVEFSTQLLIKDLYLILSEKAAAKNLELRFDIDPRFPTKLFGDDVRMRQILINIMNNSIKYTRSGSVSLKAEVLELAGDQLTARVSIKDTGVGIKPEDIDKLFMAFQRVDMEANRNIEGTGLGLSITSRILNLMGSKLEVNSTYGEGSEFFFVITLKVVDAAPIGNITVTSLGESKGGQAVETAAKVAEEKHLIAPDAKVLVVDDNLMNLKVAEGLLKRTKIQVTTCMSGFECIELMQKEHYDVILMDHMMPEMDGIETVQKIRAMDTPWMKTVPIIALTANAIQGAREMFLENGFDDFLAKPFKDTELEDMMKHFLSQELMQ